MCGQNVELLNVKLAVRIVTIGLYRVHTAFIIYTTRFNLEISEFCPHTNVCVLYNYYSKPAINSLHNINLLVFVTEMQWVY